MPGRSRPVREGPRKAEAIFAATLRLLADNGYDGLAIEAIASNAGVNKTTIYRWWPSKDALLTAALTNADALVFDMPDTGSLQGDLLALAERITALLTARHTKAIVAAVFGAAHQKPALLTLLHDFMADRLTREQTIFQRATQRGELLPTADPKTIMDLIVGAIWARLLLRGEAFTPDQLIAIVDAILHGIQQPPA